MSVSAISKPSISSDITERKLGWVLTVSGILGLFMSYGFAAIRFGLAIDPAASVQCDVGGIVRCSPILLSPGGALLGFPNSFLGIAGFTILLILGVQMVGRDVPPTGFWKIAIIPLSLAVLLVFFFEFYSIGVLGLACHDCFVVWFVTIMSFIYAFSYLHQVAGTFGGVGRFVHRWRLWILLGWAAMTAILLIVKFAES